MKKLLEANVNTYEISDVDRDLLDSSIYNWDDEWEHLIEDRGDEYINYAFYCNGILEGLMSIRKDMQESLEIYKLEVSVKNRHTSSEREISGVGTYLVSYACWLACNMYKQESAQMVSLFSKKSSDAFYFKLGGRKVDENIDDTYFLFTENIVHKLASQINEWEGK